ncbi:MAG: amidohydrolase family protein [Verrucomicrobiota bacterium]|nr:amidohydrolase family protein [Verrucomicrobiota bacterium]
MKRIDLHVHIVGNGSAGTGCWLRRAAWQWPLHALMVRHIGLPVSALAGDLDRLFADRLLELVRTSSLDAAVILAQEQVYDERGWPMEKVGAAYVPNEYVLRLAREHPEFLPAVAIHPARPDALEELERCLAEGAVMLKLLPNCQNVDCADPRYTRFWERMAEAGMPFLAHTGGEHTLPIVRPEFSDPRTLRRPLECGVTVIAAHAATKSGLTDPEYFEVLVEMFGAYPRLYADNSAFNIPIRSRVIPRCLHEPVVSRLVHGSDFPVPILGHWAWLRGFIDLATLRRCQRDPNVLERDCQLKRAMGFPEATFTRALGLLRSTPAVQALRSEGAIR